MLELCQRLLLSPPGIIDWFHLAHSYLLSGRLSGQFLHFLPPGLQTLLLFLQGFQPGEKFIVGPGLGQLLFLLIQPVCGFLQLLLQDPGLLQVFLANLLQDVLKLLQIPGTSAVSSTLL